jgi:lipopolysaccharide/colanic/teichoic acid biosynthesis glycosyltransferase
MLRLFSIYVPPSVAALLLSEAALLYTCFFVAATFRTDVDLFVFLVHGDGLTATSIVVASVLLTFYFQDLYGQLRVRSRLLLVQQTLLGFGVAFLVQALMNYSYPRYVLPRLALLMGSAAAIILLPAWRIYFSSLLTKAQTEGVVFFGRSPVVMEIADAIERSPETGLSAAAFAGAPGGDPGVALYDTLAETRAARIVIHRNDPSVELPIPALLDLRYDGFHIQQASQLYEVLFKRVKLSEVRGSDLVSWEPPAADAARRQRQSLVAFVAALAILTVAALPMLLIGLALLATGHTVLEREVRVGLYGRTFRAFRFAAPMNLLGQFLARTRLALLPRLLNVLTGEMVLVGPRPERPEFARVLDQHIPYYSLRTTVRPGMTGWAQINHHHGTAIEDAITKHEYDLYYVKHRSMTLDIYVLVGTAKILLLGRGAR